MRYTISGKNINITPGLKDAVESKLGKLERYFSPDTEVQVTLSVEKGRQKIEVTIPVKGSIIRAEQDSSDMYVSVDLVEEIIERQVKKYKTRIISKKQNALAFNEAFLQEEAEQEVETRPDINEMDYYQETLNSYSNSGQDSLYALYDLDSDGIEELIVSTGTCEADWRNDIYTIENDMVKSMGSFENTATLYKANDGNGI